MNKQINVTLSGCDDNTTATIEVSRKEYAFLIWVMRQVNEQSKDRCQPTMFIDED